jgi:hypothetical protein
MGIGKRQAGEKDLMYLYLTQLSPNLAGINTLESGFSRKFPIIRKNDDRLKAILQPGNPLFIRASFPNDSINHLWLP